MAGVLPSPKPAAADLQRCRRSQQIQPLLSPSYFFQSTVMNLAIVAAGVIIFLALAFLFLQKKSGGDDGGERSAKKVVFLFVSRCAKY